MTELERTLLEELKAISADENVLSAGQDQGMVNAMNVDRVNQGTPTREQKPPKGNSEDKSPKGNDEGTPGKCDSDGKAGKGKTGGTVAKRQPGKMGKKVKREMQKHLVMIRNQILLQNSQKSWLTIAGNIPFAFN